MSDGAEAGSEELRALLVTHNVCGVFDNLENALPFWVKELQALVREQGADFVALHMQEVGGTAWKKGNLRLETFTQAFEAGFPEFWCSGLLCDNCTQTPEAFSALGSLYLVISPTPRLAWPRLAPRPVQRARGSPAPPSPRAPLRRCAARRCIACSYGTLGGRTNRPAGGRSSRCRRRCRQAHRYRRPSRGTSAFLRPSSPRSPIGPGRASCTHAGSSALPHAIWRAEP